MASKRKPPVQVEPPITVSIRRELPFECLGIREDNPRDFLAALGLFRLLDIRFPGHGVTLVWSNTGHPVYQVCRDLPASCFEDLAALLKGLNTEKPHPFVHFKVIKVSLPAFRAAAKQSLERWSRLAVGDTLPAALYAAYGSQVHDAEKNEASPTSFSFSNGQGGKELLRDISELIEHDLSGSQLVRDLSGDPSSRKDTKSFRWHPAEYRAAAYRAPDPGGNVKGDVLPDRPSSNILAFFGLTFYPVVDRVARESTSGFSRRPAANGSSEFFTWPIWDLPLDADTISSMLHHPGLHMEASDARTMREIGCVRAWSSRRFSADKSLYFSAAGQIF
jgi:hypothetical protein